MNSEKQCQAINEQELYEDISYVQEVRKNDLKELHDKKGKRAPFKVLLLILAILSVAGSATICMAARHIINDDSIYGVLGLLAGSVLFLIVVIACMVYRPIRQLKIVREDLCPEFVPEKNLLLNGNEDLTKSDAPIIRKIVDDPSKRKIKIDNRKVARYVNPDLSFPKLKLALSSALAYSGYEMSDSYLAYTLSRLGHGRVIFISGLKEDEAVSFSASIANAFAWKSEFVKDPLSSFDDLRKVITMAPADKSSTLVSLFGLGASSCASYFSGYVDALADCSSPHSINEDFKLSNNLVVLVYLQEGDDKKGIPSPLLRYGTLFAPALVQTKEKAESFEEVKTSADEMRYLASKTVHDFFFDDQYASSFDCFAKFEAKHGLTIPNDSENAIERMEAVELCLKLPQEDVAEDVLLSNLLPYYLSKYPVDELEEAEGLLSDLKKEFSSGSIGTKIENYLAAYKAAQVESEKPEDEQPEDETPESKQPEDKPVESAEPENVQTESEQPENKEPETEQPMNEKPADEQPEAEQPEAEKAESKEEATL